MKFFAFRLLLFLILNFGALLIGGLFTNSGVNSEWYNALNQAPWTPPGFVFGIAWLSIMIFLAFYMAIAYSKVEELRKLVTIYSAQLILNIVWNPIFFYSKYFVLGLITITALTIVMIAWCFSFKNISWGVKLLLLPYCLWLMIATSLNGYIVFMN